MHINPCYKMLSIDFAEILYASFIGSRLLQCYIPKIASNCSTESIALNDFDPKF